MRGKVPTGRDSWGGGGGLQGEIVSGEQVAEGGGLDGEVVGRGDK